MVEATPGAKEEVLREVYGLTTREAEVLLWIAKGAGAVRASGKGYARVAIAGMGHSTYRLAAPVCRLPRLFPRFAGRNAAYAAI